MELALLRRSDERRVSQAIADDGFGGALVEECPDGRFVSCALARELPLHEEKENRCDNDESGYDERDAPYDASPSQTRRPFSCALLLCASNTQFSGEALSLAPASPAATGCYLAPGFALLQVRATILDVAPRLPLHTLCPPALRAVSQASTGAHWRSEC